MTDDASGPPLRFVFAEYTGVARAFMHRRPSNCL